MHRPSLTRATSRLFGLLGGSLRPLSIAAAGVSSLFSRWCHLPPNGHPLQLFDDMLKSSPPAPLHAFDSILNRVRTAPNCHVSLVFRLYRRTLLAGVVSPNFYTILVKLCSQLGHAETSLGLLGDMLKRGSSPNTIVLGAIINCVVKAGRVADAAKVFDRMPEMGCSRNIIVFNTLIRGCCFAGAVDVALALFGVMFKSGGCGPDTITLNILIDGLCKSGKMDFAVNMCARMRDLGCPTDEVTWRTIIHGFCRIGLVDLGCGFFASLLKQGFSQNLRILNSMMVGYRVVGRIEEVIFLFGKLLELRLQPNNFICGTVINCCCRCLGRVDIALGVFGYILKNGNKPDVAIFNSLVKGFCLSNRLDDAAELVRRMPAATMGCLPNTVTYNTLIRGHCSAESIDLALRLLREMDGKEGCKPNVRTYATIIRSCCKRLHMDVALGLLEEMEAREIVPNFVIYSSLLHGFTSLGTWKEASDILDKMSHL